MASGKRTVSETFQTGDEIAVVSKHRRTFVEELKVIAETMVVPLEGRKNISAMVSVKNVDVAKNGKRDALIFTDCSGSMSQCMNKLHEMVHHIATRSGDNEAEHVNIAIGKYSTDSFIPGIDVEENDTNEATLPHGYRPWNSLKETTLAGLMNFTSKYLYTSGCTNIKGMVEKGLKVLKERRRNEFDNSESHLQHLIILTDGRPDPGQTESILTTTIKEGIGNDAVVVSILLLGSRVDLKLSEAMTVGTTRGIVAYADKPTELSNSFDEILDQVLKSSRAFNIKICDNANKSFVHHFGVLTENNNTALIKLHFGEKLDSEKHPACKLALNDGASSALCIMPHYAKDENDDAWKSDAAKMPMELKDYMNALDIEEKIKNQVMNKVKTSGFEAASRLASTMTQEHESTLTAPALHRLNAFSVDLMNRSSRSNASTMTPIGRMMSASASYSQSAY